MDGSPSSVFLFFAGVFFSSGLAFLEALGVVLVGGLFLSLLDVRVIEILEKSSVLVTNRWFMKTMTLSHYKFSMKFNIPTP